MDKHRRTMDQFTYKRRYIFQKTRRFENKSYKKIMNQQMQDIQDNKRNYWQSEIQNDIKKYVQECQKYQQNKVQHMKKVEELYSLETLQKPQQEISINIIGPLPKSNDKDTIVVIVDQFSKMIRLKTTTTTASSEEIAKIYKDNIWKIHRVPRKILSNKRP